MAPSAVRNVVAAAAALTLALVGTSCGVSLGDSPSSLRPVADGVTTPTLDLDVGSFDGTGGAVFLRKAASTTAEVTTQTMTLTMTTAGMPGMGDMAITYEGSFDNVNQRGRLSMDLGDAFAASGLLGDDAGQMEVVIDGSDTYIRSELFSTFGTGKSWLRIASDELSGSSFESSTGARVAPGEFLKFLEGVGDEIETVGREDQRGVVTTHVKTTIDLEALMAQAGGQGEAGLQETLDSLGAAAKGFGSIPIEAWIDDSGYVRRFTMTFELDGLSAGDTAMTVTVDAEIYDFNVPVEIVVPDPSDVGEMDAGLFGEFPN